jgi:hypothetical protein
MRTRTFLLFVLFAASACATAGKPMVVAYPDLAYHDRLPSGVREQILRQLGHPPGHPLKAQRLKSTSPDEATAWR